nr:phospholipase D delta-like [Ipomoea batatas]
MNCRFAVEGVVAGGIKQKNIAAEGRNCRVLGDIGNMVTLRGAEGKQQLPQAGTKAPRQPWHDLHCRIDGPAAYDVLIDFAQRWRRATSWRESFGKEFTSIPEDDPKLYVNENDQSKHWHVQIFCSIDSGSVKGFPKRIDIAEKQNLICGKNLAVDKSIETAYIQAIRSAQNFIYIENQYFLGSSYAWPSYEDAVHNTLGADHLIPMELAMKVVSKIRASQRKSQTMHMMYQVIAQEIKSMQLDEHHSDYLNFYCLGNREDVPSSVSQSISGKDNVSESLKFQRFMIYVHAKGMIVDGEYVIVGSANINQRSMAGSKDTEIAMGGYQPHHTWARKQRRPHGQVQTV